MKVLWFSNTPANAVDCIKDSVYGGGWLKTLDKAVQSKVELNIAFYYPKLQSSFKHLQTVYHPLGGTKNWRIHSIKAMVFHTIKDQDDLEEYLKIIAMVKPDIVHIHGTENPFGCIIPYTDVPVVVSIQGCMTVYYHKFLSGFSLSDLHAISLVHYKSIRQFLRHKSFIRAFKEYRKMKFREIKNLKYTKYLIGRTDWDRRLAAILAPEGLYFHGDELLRDAFYKNKWINKRTKKLIVHTTSANNAYKGFETLCEALHELNNMQKVETEWQIVGINENDDIVKVTKRKLKNRFPKSGLVFLGSVNEEELAKMLCFANIYVSPSHIENSPNSLCEAMLIGMPCIATFAGGTGSLLKDKEEGVLIQDGDPWSMAGAILELYHNPAQASEYGRNARERALIRHNPDRVIRELIASYQNIIQTNTNKK